MHESLQDKSHYESLRGMNHMKVFMSHCEIRVITNHESLSSMSHKEVYMSHREVYMSHYEI